MPRRAEHPYLSSNYAPVPDETSIHDLVVDGIIPPGLHGRYLRIGPNPIGNPGRPYAWDGDGMVHAVHLQPGASASYRNRWVTTARAGALLGTEPPGGETSDLDDRANRDIVSLGGRAVAVGSQSAYELDGGLETRRRIAIVSGANRLWGRARVHPTTGALHVFSSKPRARSAVLHVVSAAGELSESREVSLAGGPQVSDFVVTDHFAVLFRNDAIGVLEPDARKVEWMALAATGSRRIDPFGAFEHGDELTVYLAAPSLSRCVIDLTRHTIRSEHLDRGRRCAYVRFNEDHVPRSPRYLYAISPTGSLPYSGTEIHRYDLATGRRVSTSLGSDRHPGEFVFVADPTRRQCEDGGWVVGFVHDDRAGRAVLLVLDAADLEAPAVATVHITRRVPYGHHGVWMPARPICQSPRFPPTFQGATMTTSSDSNSTRRATARVAHPSEVTA